MGFRSPIKRNNAKEGIVMKYTVAMKMDRKEIMEIRSMLIDVQLANSWGMASPLTFDEMKELGADICNWLLDKKELTGMDLVMLDWAIHALECMSRKLYIELEKMRSYEQIRFLKEKFLSIRKIFSMDRSC